MPGYVDGILETKLVSVFAGNEGTGVPTHQALIAVFDHRNGSPLALMDGTHITAARTGAAAAVSVRTLARDDAAVLAVLGAGVQGRSHVDAVGRVRPFRECGSRAARSCGGARPRDGRARGDVRGGRPRRRRRLLLHGCGLARAEPRVAGARRACHVGRRVT